MTVEIVCGSHNSRLDKGHFITVEPQQAWLDKPPTQGKSPSEHVLSSSTHSEGLLRGENDKQYDRQEKETFEGGVNLYFPVDEVII